VSQKLCQCSFVNNSEKHWLILIIFGCNIVKERDVNDCRFSHLIFILLLHYLVKCKSCSLAVYDNEFILGSTCCLRKSLYIIIYFFYRNPFIFDRQGTKDKLAQFYGVGCSSWVKILCLVVFVLKKSKQPKKNC